MSQVNLLPPEILQAHKTRRTAAIVGVAGAVVVALIFLFYLVQVGRLGGVRDEIEAQNATNAALQSEIATLQRFEELQARAQARQALLGAAFANEVSFSGMLMDLSQVIPSDAVLDSFDVQLTSATAPETVETTTGTTTGFVGTITASGQALGVDSVSLWLTQLEQIEGWVNPWASSVTAGEGTSVFTFSSTVDLTPAVRTRRGSGAADER
jgi:Tfp pilus assembly protein PilN